MQQQLFDFSQCAAVAGLTERQHRSLVKREFIVAVYRQPEVNFNQCRAAKQLGMHRNTLSRANKELKIDVTKERDRFIAEQAKKAAASVKQGVAWQKTS